VQSPRSRAELAAATLVLLAALLLARRGTPPARAAAVLCVALPIVALAWRRARERALWREPSRVVSRLAGRVDPDRAGRAIRALGLIADPVAGGTSVDLAQLHVARTLGALPQDRILDRAVRIGARYGRVAVLLATGAIALGATRGFAVFEGADVLVATRLREPGGFAAFNGLEEICPRPGYKVSGEERAWSRRLAKRFGAEGKVDDRSFVVRGDGSPCPVFDFEPEDFGIDPDVVELMGTMDGERRDALIVFGWAMSEELATGFKS